MKRISLKESDIKKLKKFPLKKIICTEGVIYYYKKGENGNQLLKKLYLTDKERVNRKMKTIETLLDSELSKYNELVIPNAVVSVEGKNSGFVMKEVMNSNNLHLLLEDESIPFNRKIKLLKEVGKLVEKVERQPQEFYFGDLQDYNILVGENDQISIIDLDSSAVNQKTPLDTKYMVIDSKTYTVDKYKMAAGGRAYPSREVDIFCYNTMVLNFLSNYPMNRLTYEDYFSYMDYLEDISFPKEMVDIYRNHYTNKENKSVFSYLENIEEKEETSYKVYQKQKD